MHQQTSTSVMDELDARRAADPQMPRRSSHGIEVIDPFTLRGWVIVKRFEAHHGAVAWLGLDLMSPCISKHRHRSWTNWTHVEPPIHRCRDGPAMAVIRLGHSEAF
jgi:hypothetical protein